MVDIIKDKILITGSSGLIGSYLYDYFNDRFNVVGLDIRSGKKVDHVIDVSDSDVLIKKLNEVMPDIIIHTAAIKGLSDCESDKLGSWKTNVGSTETIVNFANKQKIKVIYISSDVVFDGIKGDYTEDDIPNPINFYGKTKYESELLVSSLEEYAICRTSLVIGKPTTNDLEMLDDEIKKDTPLNNQSLLPYYILKKIRSDRIVKMPKEIISSPTGVDLLAKMIERILLNSKKGIFNCAGAVSLSRYDFAIKVVDFFNENIKYIEPDENAILAIRPKNLSMNVSKTYKELGLDLNDGGIYKLLELIKHTDL